MREGKAMLGLIAEAVDIPKELLPGMPLIEIAGGGQLLIENHCGVTEYTDCRIRVQVGFGFVCIYGRELRIASMKHKQLVIVGTLHGLELERRAVK